MGYLSRIALTALLIAVTAAAIGLRAPDAHAVQKYGFHYSVPANGFVVVNTAFRHIYKVTVYYTGDDEIVIAGGLFEDQKGVWGQARNRSNKSSEGHPRLRLRSMLVPGGRLQLLGLRAHHLGLLLLARVM